MIVFAKYLMPIYYLKTKIKIIITRKDFQTMLNFHVQIWKAKYEKLIIYNILMSVKLTDNLVQKISTAVVMTKMKYQQKGC